MKAVGRARVENEVVDLSVLVDTGLKGINAVLGITERGPIGKTILVGSWTEYTKHFGGLLATSKFPLICRRALESGGKLRIGRVVHYDDISDYTTLAGTKASKTHGGVVFEADNVGGWGNSLKFSIANAANGVAGEMDITVELAGYPDLGQTIQNVKATLDAETINKFNEQSLLLKIVSGALLTVTTTAISLTMGSTSDLIQLSDYIGDEVAKNGLHCFDDDNDFVKIAVPEIADPLLDMAIINYVEKRQDCRAVLRTPIGINGTTAVDYREGQGIYSHQPLDSWFGDMFFAGLEVIDPKDSGRKFIPNIGDVLGAMSRRDNNSYEWFSVGGSKRGQIKNCLGVDYNVGSPARSTEFDQLDVRGLNAVIDDRDYGVVIWGNNTLSKKPTMLKHSNIADLLVFLTRSMNPLIKSELFDPNDIETWKAIYRRLRPLLEMVKNKRGVWDYLYQGDQFIDDISEAVVNDTQNIDKGQYVFLLWLKPKAALKYVGVKAVVTNSGVSFEELLGQPTV